MGRVAEYDLDKMIKRSDIIVVGKVVELRETGNEADDGMAIIKIDQLLKGAIDSKKVTVTYGTDTVDEDASFIIGAQCVLFLQKIDTEKYSVTQGYAGRLYIRNNKVIVVYIRGEKGTWPLNIFIKKVVGIVKKGNEAGE
jgi:hypothetical protein